MKKRFLFFMFGLLWSISTSFGQSPDYYLLVGTYTKKGSDGIYVYNFNTQNAAFSHQSNTKGVLNPSFLCISPNQQFVYAAGENDNKGAVNAFRFDKKTGILKFLNSQSAEGDWPCHVAIDKTGKWVMVGNYGAGNFSLLPTNTDGTLSKASQTIQHEGKSINTERQNSPHVHSINISPNNEDVFVVDLGTDKIYSYVLDDNKGVLQTGTPAYHSTVSGAGPRHFTFHPNQKFAYSLQELDGTINTFKYQTGKLTPIQNISTFPEGYVGNKWCADIHTSPDGKFLYASNRGNATLSIYSINTQTGILSLVGYQSVLGKTPRNFSIDPTGKYLLVANQDSDNVIIFARNLKTGLLTPTGTEIKVSMPVCLQWMPK
jgi:6-phosphogluconolactonase